MILFTIQGINQARHRAWEKLQSEINISAKEVIKIFEEGGIHLENIEDITNHVSKGLYGEPSLAFDTTFRQEKSYSIGILEYQDWSIANHTFEFQKEYLETNSLDYEGGLFLHGAVVVIIDPPNKNLVTQLQKILMDRYTLSRQETKTK